MCVLVGGRCEVCVWGGFRCECVVCVCVCVCVCWVGGGAKCVYEKGGKMRVCVCLSQCVCVCVLCVACMCVCFDGDYNYVCAHCQRRYNTVTISFCSGDFRCRNRSLLSATLTRGRPVSYSDPMPGVLRKTSQSVAAAYDLNRPSGAAQEN